MAMTSIAEFTLQPGRRDEFVRLFESLLAENLEAVHASGCHGATLHLVVGDPDRAVEIAEWESVEARERATTGEAFAVFAPLFELVASFEATMLVRPE